MAFSISKLSGRVIQLKSNDATGTAITYQIGQVSSVDTVNNRLTIDTSTLTSPSKTLLLNPLENGGFTYEQSGTYHVSGAVTRFLLFIPLMHNDTTLGNAHRNLTGTIETFKFNDITQVWEPMSIIEYISWYVWWGDYAESAPLTNSLINTGTGTYNISCLDNLPSNDIFQYNYTLATPYYHGILIGNAVTWFGTYKTIVNGNIEWFTCDGNSIGEDTKCLYWGQNSTHRTHTITVVS